MFHHFIYQTLVTLRKIKDKPAAVKLDDVVIREGF